MALRNIVTVDTDRTSVLRKKTRIVEKFDERLKELAADMIETMHEANGVGVGSSSSRYFAKDVCDEC